MSYAKMFSVGIGDLQDWKEIRPAYPYIQFVTVNGECLKTSLDYARQQDVSRWKSGTSSNGDLTSKELQELVEAYREGSTSPFDMIKGQLLNGTKVCWVVLPSYWRDKVANYKKSVAAQEQANAAKEQAIAVQEQANAVTRERAIFRQKLVLIGVAGAAALVLGGIGYGVYRIVR